MNGSATWTPLGRGLLSVDWSATLKPTTRFDPYLLWYDTTPGLQELPLILELSKPFDRDALVALNELGLRVTPHYIDWHLANGVAPRYVTATSPGHGCTRALFDSVAAGIGPVVRYELGNGLPNPDYSADPATESSVIASNTGPDQAWQPAPPIAPIAHQHVVGFIDYGCAFVHRHFDRDDQGSLRVHALWNQEQAINPSAPGRPQVGWKQAERFACGWYAEAPMLQVFRDMHGRAGALDELSCYRDAQYEPVLRHATHGAFVMDVATGFPNPLRHQGSSERRHEHPIVFVQLARHLNGRQVAGLLRAHVMDAAHFIALHIAQEQRAVINLSYGGYCGPHDGSSILERALDELIDSFGNRLALIVPSGNAFDQDIHAQLQVPPGGHSEVSWENLPDDPSDSVVEVWWPKDVPPRVRVTDPTGQRSPWLGSGATSRLERNGKTAAVLSVTSRPCQAQSGSMALLAVAPTAVGAAPYGRWCIEIDNADGMTEVTVDAWCERDDPVFGSEGGPRQSRFVDHLEPTGTLNALAHGRSSTVVGGYTVDDTTTSLLPGPVAMFSGTGPGRGLPGRIRQEGTAPRGPQILGIADTIFQEGVPAAAVISGDEVRLAGTSVAAAHYTRAYINEGFRRPAARRAGPSDGHGPNSHPDNLLDIPRV